MKEYLRERIALSLQSLGLADLVVPTFEKPRDAGHGDLTTDAKDKLSVVGDVLAKHPELKVRIEGNCDERGSEQYNLALGQRRAEAARKYLDNLGVKHEQITAISFGAERPKAQGHDEEAWKQNRRDDFNAQK